MCFQGNEGVALVPCLLWHFTQRLQSSKSLQLGHISFNAQITFQMESKPNAVYRDLRREFLSRAAQYFSMKEHSVTFLRLQWNIFGTRVRQLSTGKASEIWEANLLVFALFETFQLKEVLPISLSSFWSKEMTTWYPRFFYGSLFNILPTLKLFQRMALMSEEIFYLVALTLSMLQLYPGFIFTIQSS